MHACRFFLAGNAQFTCYTPIHSPLLQVSMIYYICSGGITLCGNTKGNSALFPITHFVKEPSAGALLLCMM